VPEEPPPRQQEEIRAAARLLRFASLSVPVQYCTTRSMRMKRDPFTSTVVVCIQLPLQPREQILDAFEMACAGAEPPRLHARSIHQRQQLLYPHAARLCADLAMQAGGIGAQFAISPSTRIFFPPAFPSTLSAARSEAGLAL